MPLTGKQTTTQKNNSQQLNTFSGDPKIIVKSKNTEMLGKVMYVDNNHRCYKYKKSEILCPLDKTIKVISI